MKTARRCITPNFGDLKIKDLTRVSSEHVARQFHLGLRSCDSVVKVAATVANASPRCCGSPARSSGATATTSTQEYSLRQL